MGRAFGADGLALMGVLGLMAPLAWRDRRHWMGCRAARA
jgi:hypothetical protein